MATRGMSEFRSGGVDYTINDPNIADEFSTETAYSVGDYVTHNGNLYRFKKDHTAGAWSASHVSLVKIGAKMKEQETAISNLKTKIRIFGSVYTDACWYGNGVRNISAYVNSCHFDVEGFEKIEATITTAQWYDVYDFLDAEMNVLEYEFETSSGSTVKLSLDVPSNAKYFVTNSSNAASATVYAYVFTDDNLSSKSLAPVSVVNEYVHQNYSINKTSSYTTYIYDVSAFERATIQSYAFQYSRGYALADADFSILQGAETTNTDALYNSGNDGYKYTEKIGSAKYLLISVQNDKTPTVTVYVDPNTMEVKQRRNNSFKRIVWYGTSIPAAGYKGEGNTNSYPLRVGKIIGAQVSNMAVGSSSVTCKDPTLISEGNPYGFVNDFELCSRCLTNTVEEMQWIIDHFDDTSVFTYRTVQSLTDAQKADILSFSYENRVVSFLAQGTEPDMWVFDHGFNDLITEDDENYDKKEELTGTLVAGWYKNGDFHDTGINQSIEFDCSDYDMVILNNARIGAYYDVYDLFDAYGNYMSSEEGIYKEVTHNNQRIDTRGAARIVISCGGQTACEETELYGLPYGDPDMNKYSYRGAMGFLFNLILSYNPRSRIVMIGNYCDDPDSKMEYITNHQEWLADYWDMPIYKQWEFYGWTNKVITTQWKWEDNVFVQGNVSHQMRIRDCWLADGTHPHTDESGKSLQYMANHIAAWIQNEIWTQYQK